MAIAVATGVLICLLFTVSIKAMYEGGKIQQLEWDMATVTAGDYSVEFPIKSNDQSCGYDWWKANIYRAPGGPFEQGIAPAFALKEYLKKEIEEKLDQWVRDNNWAVEEVYGKSKKKKVTGQEVPQYGGTKVADIVFSFNNAPLIEALRARGGKIAANDFDGMRECEVKVNELFNDFETLTIPTAAFITFESDDSATFGDMIGDKKS